ncbi:MAG: hypothetical protein DRO14_06250 [Thermoprotei archaeon]|nr:MAG: hypothetical protein DRO14_06250 [Thermoprotei archaeon]
MCEDVRPLLVVFAYHLARRVEDICRKKGVDCSIAIETIEEVMHDILEFHDEIIQKAVMGGE